MVAVGKPLQIDTATTNKTRPSCARVKVNVDLMKGHPTMGRRIINTDKQEIPTLRIKTKQIRVPQT